MALRFRNSLTDCESIIVLQIGNSYRLYIRAFLIFTLNAGCKKKKPFVYSNSPFDDDDAPIFQKRRVFLLLVNLLYVKCKVLVSMILFLFLVISFNKK